MAFVDMETNHQNVAYSNTPGEGNIAQSSPGTTRVAVRPLKCIGCVHEKAHNVTKVNAWVIDKGKSRNDHIPEANKITPEKANRVMSGINLAYLATHGYGWNVFRNAVYFGTVVEIVSVSGTRATVRGKNPNRLNVNGEWKSIPSWSALRWTNGAWGERGMGAYIINVIPPDDEELDDVEYEVELTIDADEAMTPKDLLYPPEKYWGVIEWDGRGENVWKNFQEYEEAQFTVREIVVEAPGVVNLTDSQGNGCRVLYPDMENINDQLFPGGPITVVLVSGEVETSMSVVDMRLRLSTEQTVDGWSVELDLTGLSFDEARVKYCPEVTAIDNVWVNRVASCQNCQKDWSGSYDHQGGKICTNVESTGFDDFRGKACWQPECDGFNYKLLDGRTYGSGAMDEADRLKDKEFWSSLWTRTGLVIKQAVAGSDQFGVTRPPGGGPGFGALTGGFRNSVPIDLDAYTQELTGAVFGKLYRWTDGSGNDHLETVSGTFFLEGKDFSAAGGPNLTQSFDAPTAGLIAEGGSWLGSLDLYGAGMGNSMDHYPTIEGGVYIGKCNVGASFATSEGGLDTVLRKNVKSESWVVAFDFSTDAALDAEVAVILNGIE